MASSKFDEIRQLLSEYSVERADESINNDLLCVLCKKLMIDACESTCGCHYCYTCINSYLSKNHKYCPGERSECKEEYLNIERDVFRNIRLSTRISRILVKCPKITCTYKCELAHLLEHLEECRKPSIKCPYTDVGCGEVSLSKDIMTRHLSDQVLCHTQLMTSFVTELKNEINRTKQVSEIAKEEICLLKEDLKIKDILNEEKRIEIDFLIDELRNKDNMVMVLDQELKSMRNEILKEIASKENETLKIESQMEAYRQEIEVMKNVLEEVEWTNMKIQIKELKKEIYEVKINIESNNEDRERKMNNLIRLNKLSPNIDMDFMWRIEEYSKKRRTVTDVYSDSFHSHSYKFCLNLYIYGDNVGLWCVIMKGEKDDFLEWPMRRAVTLSIIEQESLKSHKTTVFQYDTYQRNKRAFDRPKDERNDYCIGTDSLVRYSYIKETPLILVNDSIVVTCVIN